MKLALGATLLVSSLLHSACSQEAEPEMLPSLVNPETATVSSQAPIHKGFIWNGLHRKWVPVSYAVVNGMAVFEGDMILGTAEEMVARTRKVEAQGGTAAGSVQAQGVAVEGGDSHWLGAVVPYTIDPALPNPSRVTDAINEWTRSTTRVRYVLRTASNAGQYPDYVTFKVGTDPNSSSSSLGRVGGQQFVELNSDCSVSCTIHEIGHTLSLLHEQSREDRDSFVRIIEENIMYGYAHAFKKHPADSVDLGAYDFKSIMHYHKYAFSKDPVNALPTIEALNGESFGNSMYPSYGDTAAVNSLYSVDNSEFFLGQTYMDVLNRKADTYGFSNYLTALRSCNGNSTCLASTRASIARELLESPENRQQDPDLNPSSPNYNAAFITHCFTNFLRRQPDAQGFNWWLNDLNAGGNYTAVVNGFINSSEYRQRFNQ
ncbi:M12 family metallopeptidase [Corallococcus llansteffanensis]|nr:M12 family metallopeptidase [Corallococcus llansteffanensis]